MRLISAVLTVFLLAQTVTAAERPARMVQIGEQNIMTLTSANTVIVTDKNASSVTRFAAMELQGFLEKVLSGKIPLVHQPEENKNSIILGLNQWSKPVIDEKKLVRDAFFIRTQGKRIYIAGIDDPKINPHTALAKGGVWSQLYERGTLFGVYDFLERFAGVRMYFPGELGTIIPERKQLSIPEIRIYDRPDFTQRKVSTFWDGEYFEGSNRDAVIHPTKTLNSYRLRLETDHLPCCHGLNGFRYIQRFGKTNPEYFALQSNGKRHNDMALPHPGQLCYTSGVLEEIYQDTKSYLKGEKADIRKIPAPNGKGYAWGVNTKAQKYVDLMPQDAFSGCHCANCQKAYKKEDPHYATELIWKNTVDIANRLKKENVPGIITMMAYRPYRRVPALEIPDNVMVMVAETGPWSKGNPEQKKIDNEEIKAWTKKLGRKVWIWNYVGKLSSLSMPGIPQMTPRAYGEYYKEIAPWIFGAFAESESERFLYNYLNYYVFAKIAWKNDTDLEKLLNEHYQLMFGKAAGVMQKFYEKLEDNWVNKIGGRVVDTPLGPVGAPPSDYDLWNKVYSPAALAELTADLDQAQKLAAGDTLALKRIALIRKEFLEPIRKASAEYLEKTSAVKGFQFRIKNAPDGTIQLVPFQGKNKKTVKTAVQAWFSADALHLKFDCEEPEMQRVTAKTRKFDDPEIWRDNSVEIFLNPSADRKTYYQLIINSDGSVSDQKCVKLGATAQTEWSWNSNAKVEIRKNATSWTADVSIPLKQLPGLKKESFPANFSRNRILDSGTDYEMLYTWSPFVRGFHDLENFGSLTTGNDSLLINGDFSMKPTISKRHFGIWKGSEWIGGWIGADNTPSRKNELDDKIFFSAPYSMKLESSTGASVTHYLPNLKPDTRYRLTFYVKLQNVKPLKASASGVCANLWDDANRWFPSHNWLTGTSDWTRQSFEFTSGKKTNQKVKSYLSLRMMNASGTAWFDDVILEEIPMTKNGK